MCMGLYFTPSNTYNMNLLTDIQPMDHMHGRHSTSPLHFTTSNSFLGHGNSCTEALSQSVGDFFFVWYAISLLSYFSVHPHCNNNTWNDGGISKEIF